jgi:hypothetical protein
MLVCICCPSEPAVGHVRGRLLNRRARNLLFRVPHPSCPELRRVAPEWWVRLHFVAQVWPTGFLVGRPEAFALVQLRLPAGILLFLFRPPHTACPELRSVACTCGSVLCSPGRPPSLRGPGALCPFISAVIPSPPSATSAADVPIGGRGIPPRFFQSHGWLSKMALESFARS